jgi:hypothetical protein
MKWDIYKAKAWAMRNGMDHIKGGLYAEGGELIYEAKWGEGCDTEASFREAIKDILCYEDEDIDDIVKEIMS